ncbi:iron-containing alcohol dehydrogenase [Bacillus thuringiensis]|uniref:iron-containing alcohol dehydrogenase n=1 Tax=Bacillus thuringiensis TaxID=1428 RepID=UPI000BF28998|nr:iron-containing alcohol dehydrogenase [Bacillus thuringiensis]PEY73211.1 NADH-dependent alcohol dehydrogenase [Bacillus thuringiensis]
MKNFVFQNPTKLIFGKRELEQLRTEIPKYGKKVLIVYGKGSIKQNGIYSSILTILNELNVEVFELSGVEPNPRLSTVKKGIHICKEYGIEFILAVGGGSVIDCTKSIAAGAKYEGDVWGFITKKEVPVEALPFGTVLTVAATGSEMNEGSVITNWETKEKYGWGSMVTFPKFSILDPMHSISVPRDQTIYGAVDIMSHVFEQYFHQGKNTPLQDRYSESLLRTVIETAPMLLNDLENYEHRETMMYSAAMALNGNLSMGICSDWATHNIEHALSAVYDIPHGAGLAILFPNWMKYVVNENIPRFKQFAIQVFNIASKEKTDYEIALAGIEALRNFWTSIGAPSRLIDYGIGEDKLDELVEKVMVNGDFGNFKRLNKEDVLAIYQASL